MNLGIRIEDTILVPEHGIEKFTPFAPSELRNTDSDLGANGVVQKFPPVLTPLVVF